MRSLNRARVILVGNGRMGKIRAGLLYANPRFEISGIVDTDISAASALADAYNTKPFTSITDAIEHHNMFSSGSKKPIEAVVISTPTFTHNDLILESASQGLSIFTEKPVESSSEKIKFLFDHCDAKGIKLCCSFQRRFDASYVANQDALSRGVIGKPLTARMFFGDNPCPPPEFLLAGGDIFMDLSAHDVDYIRWCLNDEVKSVYATGTSSTKMLRDAGIHDNATLLMNFKKGAVVTLFMSRSASYGYDQRCEIFGDAGLLKIENEYSHSSSLSNHFGVNLGNLKHSFPERFRQAYESELEAFADTIQYNKVWPVSSRDCIAVQKITEAARLSCDRNQVIELDNIEDIDVARDILCV